MTKPPLPNDKANGSWQRIPAAMNPRDKNPRVNKVVMTELTKSSQTNGKYLSKAKSADKPLATTKPCSHECTLDFGNAKTLDVGNAKPQMAGTTLDAQEC